MASTWTYTPGGTRLGDRIMAMKPFMLEKGGQKYWNELYTFATRTIAGVATNITVGSNFGAIDLANASDVSAVVPKNFADPMGNQPVASGFDRQMPGYNYPTVQVFVFQGFVG
jgi:hypothetical protein